MTAATTPIVPEYEITDCPALPLANGFHGVQGTMAVYDTSDNLIKPAASGSTTLVPIGRFENDVDNTAGSAPVNCLVRLDRPVLITYWANDTVNPVTELFSKAYMLDNQTVTESASGNSLAGEVWRIDAIKGIGVVTPPF
jgi:hypothetical protein